MLLLKMLLFCEVCTLLLQMETLQSRHLPSPDGLACCFLRVETAEPERATDGRREGQGAARGHEHPGPGCAGTERPGAFNRERTARSSLRIWVMSNLLFW